MLKHKETVDFTNDNSFSLPKLGKMFNRKSAFVNFSVLNNAD